MSEEDVCSVNIWAKKGNLSFTKHNVPMSEADAIMLKEDLNDAYIHSEIINWTCRYIEKIKPILNDLISEDKAVQLREAYSEWVIDLKKSNHVRSKK